MVGQKQPQTIFKETSMVMFQQNFIYKTSSEPDLLTSDLENGEKMQKPRKVVRSDTCPIRNNEVGILEGKYNIISNYLKRKKTVKWAVSR